MEGSRTELEVGRAAGGPSAPPSTEAHRHAIDAAALQALSSLARKGEDPMGRPPARVRGPNLLITFGAAVLVGAALFFAQPLRYEHQLQWHVLAEAPAARAEYRTALLSYAWENVSSLGPWAVHTPSEQVLQLRVSLRASAPMPALDTLRDGFLASLEQTQHQRRQRVTPAESLLTDYLGDLHQRLDDAQTRVEAAINQLPSSDPRPERDALRDSWREMQTEFQTRRESLIAASSKYSRLRASAPPSDGIVSSDERREALQANTALQQDLQELTLALQAVQLQLQTVEKNAAGHLQQLQQVTQTLRDACAQDYAWLRNRDLVQTVELYRKHALAYADRLDAFTSQWTAEFEVVERAAADPMQSSLLSAHQRIRQLVGDFLFESSKELASLREALDQLASGPGDDARDHVLHSDLRRAAQFVQAAHHRFEFAAGEVEASNNFRLDTALRTARGLQRRTQAAINAADEQLRTQAVQRARERHAAALAEAKQTLDTERGAADRAIERIVALQEQLNLSSVLSEDYLQAMLQAELATARVRAVEETLGDAQDQLQTLEAKRAEKMQLPVESLNYTVAERPTNLFARLRIGGLGALLTLVCTWFGQRWVPRRGT
jgi:hypothetical protein